MTKIDVENAFRNFVKTYGGEVVEDLLPNSPSFKNADFIFQDQRIIAELKSLQEDKSSDKNIQKKIQEKFDKWMNSGVIPPRYGTVRVESKDLPEKCRKELIDVYKPPIQTHVKKANKQIKETLENFNIQDGKGLLIVVNDGNYALEADAVLYLLWRILGGDFKRINSIIYCTVNMFAKAPGIAKATLFWAHVTRKEVDPVDEEFISNMFRAWCQYLEEITGAPIEKIELNDPAIVKEIKYLKSS